MQGVMKKDCINYTKSQVSIWSASSPMWLVNSRYGWYSPAYEWYIPMYDWYIQVCEPNTGKCRLLIRPITVVKDCVMTINDCLMLKT